MQRPRTTAARKADVLRLLEPSTGVEKDAWVASASMDGKVHLVPLSYYWDGEALVMATGATSRTARNLRGAGHTRIALGTTRNVVVIDGSVAFVETESAPEEMASAHAAFTGFDARTSGRNVYLRITPAKIQAWREENELAGRVVMSAGVWLTA